MFKILVGMSLISVVAELFLSGSHFKKYVRAVIGIFIFTIIVEGIVASPIYVGGDHLIKEAEILSDKTIAAAQKEIVTEYETNIEKELKNNSINIKRVEVKCDENLVLKSVNIELFKKTDEIKMKEILKDEMGIDEKIIKTNT